jgi:hypothetical protein
MLDISHIPTQYPNADVQVFVGNNVGTTSNWQTWIKPRGKSMGHLLIVGAGGNGGNGVIGANSLAGGGGGGGSGGQTSLRFPLHAIPDRLYISLMPTQAATASKVAIDPTDTVNNCFALANYGGNGGNGTAVPAGGTAGSGATVAAASAMPLGYGWLQLAIVGQAGIVGGAAVSSGSLALPTTGLLVTGGGGGGGLPAAATFGTNGGSITGAGVFPSVSTAGGGGSATVPGLSGSAGFKPIPNLLYFYGGTGGGSTHGSATGAGLVQASGGDGAYGCGGGGSGAALTGSTAGVGGKGGPAICIITCW